MAGGEIPDTVALWERWPLPSFLFARTVDDFSALIEPNGSQSLHFFPQ